MGRPHYQRAPARRQRGFGSIAQRVSLHWRRAQGGGGAGEGRPKKFEGRWVRVVAS